MILSESSFCFRFFVTLFSPEICAVIYIYISVQVLGRIIFQLHEKFGDVSEQFGCRNHSSHRWPYCDSLRVSPVAVASAETIAHGFDHDFFVSVKRVWLFVCRRVVAIDSLCSTPRIVLATSLPNSVTMASVNLAKLILAMIFIDTVGITLLSLAAFIAAFGLGVGQV